MTELVFERLRYTSAVRAWLAKSGHYLDNPPPGCLFVVGVKRPTEGLFGLVGGELVGLCLVGRPVARHHPQDGSVGEVTRFVLTPGLPHGTASQFLRFAATVARKKRMKALISYHDRARHTGCIYRKAGFRKDGVTEPRTLGWGSRSGRKSAGAQGSKRRWRLDLATEANL